MLSLFSHINQSRRRARSTTPVRGPLHLNPDREQLLISLSESETDIAQITKQLSSVKDILTKLKFVCIYSHIFHLFIFNILIRLPNRNLNLFDKDKITKRRRKKNIYLPSNFQALSPD